MQLDHDIILLLVGAGIGLSSSLLTSLFQSWLSRREFERRREQEKKAELKRIVLPTAIEISRFSPIEKVVREKAERPSRENASLSVNENSINIYIDKPKSKLSRILAFGNKHFSISLLVISTSILVFGYLIYELLLVNWSPVLLSIIVAIILFLFTHLIVELVKNKIISDKQERIFRAEEMQRIAESKERTAKLPKCPKCGLPFVSDYEVNQHIKRWHSQ